MPVSEPTVPRNYASAAASDATTGGHSTKVSKPPGRNNTYEPSEKFNIVIFKCRQGARLPKRLAFDLSKVESVLTEIDGSLKSSSIKECYHFERYRAD